MATIIDSLIVKLGLDTTDYDKGRKKVGGSLKDTGREAKEMGKKVKEGTKEGAAGFSDIAKEATKFLAVIGGTAAITNFAKNVIESSAALNRFSQNINESLTQINALSGAAEVAGGSAEGLQASLDMLSKAQTELKLTGNSSLLPFFNALKIAPSEAAGSVTDLFQVIHNRMMGMDRKDAFNLGQMFGIDAGTMNLLLSSDQEFKDLLEWQTKLNKLTETQAKQFSAMQRSLKMLGQETEAFGISLLSDASPALEKIIDLFRKFGDWCTEHEQFITIFLGTLAVELAAVGIAAIPISGTAVAILSLAAAFAALWDDYQTFKSGGNAEMPWDKWIPNLEKAYDLLTKVKNKIQEYGYNFVTKLLGAGGALIAAAQGDRKGMQIAYGAGSGTYSPSSGGGSAAAAMAYFQSQGWSKEQAAGIVANISKESGFNAGAVGDSGKAYGLAQWHPDRQSEFRKLFGKDIQGSSFNEQLAFIQHELTKGNEQGAGARLRGARTADEAGGIVSRYYERPANTAGEMASRAALARQFMGIPGASQAAMAGGAIASNTPSRSVTNSIGEMKIYTQATDAEGIMRDAGQAIDYLSISQANTGQM